MIWNVWLLTTGIWYLQQLQKDSTNTQFLKQTFSGPILYSMQSDKTWVKKKYLQSIVVYYFLIKVRSWNVLQDKDKTCIYRLLSTTKNVKPKDYHGFTKNDITFRTSYLTFRHIYILIIQIKMFCLADIKSCGNFKNNKEIFFFLQRHLYLHKYILFAFLLRYMYLQSVFGS